jgi:alkylation response protein AidB-like acyl-CoA dehydrogenase
MHDPIAIAEAVAREFEATAVERDRAGGTPKRERDALRASGLLSLVVPAALGGTGADWMTAMQTVRIIGRADGSLAHVFGFQHLLVSTVRLFGTTAQYEPLARATAERRLFWGNALNPLDDRAVLERRGGEYVMNGKKSFSSGSHDVDMLVVSAQDAATKKLMVAVIPGDRAGVTAIADWDNMGQRQTDSGSVVFQDVKIAEHELLTSPGPLGSTFASLRPLIAQLSLVNVYLGIAEGASRVALGLTRGRGKAWFASGVEKVEDDPFVLATFGDLHCELEAARHVARAAAEKLDAAWNAGDALTPAGRGEVAVAVATAKVIATRAGLEVTNRLFDGVGARGTTAKLALDRYWRNLRTHTLHDPVDYKRRDIGRWLLADAWPTPSFYS